jgi:Inorganic H+ pyrophosphatase
VSSRSPSPSRASISSNGSQDDNCNKGAPSVAAAEVADGGTDPNNADADEWEPFRRRRQQQPGDGEDAASSFQDDNRNSDKTARLNEIYNAIYEGAESFPRAEYTVCFGFILFFSILILVLVSWGTGWDAARGVCTALSFLLGALTSMGCGYLGMKVAVYSNVRTTISAQKSG